MIARFIVNEIDKIRADIALGRFYLISDAGEILFEYEAKSGGWGKGFLEFGEYLIKWLDHREYSKHKEGYTLFDFPWFAYIEPQFETKRSDLGIHPDGNIEGTLGCIGIKFKNLDDSVRCHNLIRDALDIKSIPLMVMNFLGDTRNG